MSGVIILKSEELWDKFLVAMQEKMNPISFNTWFKPLKLQELNTKDNKIIIQVPMGVHKTTLETSWHQVIEETLQELTGNTFELVYVLEDLQTAKEKSDDKVRSKKINEEVFVTNLKKEFTFDNFVTGDTNKFAKTAAIAVAEAPGKIYNPLFMYGKSGVGKTHLMHAIGNYIIDRDNTQRVVYVTSESFVNEIVEAIRDKKGDGSNSMQEFRNKYRNVDVLLIDDIQFIIGKETMQQEFFHTFNHLYESQKQIVISSDKHPATMKTLEERLRSRFEMGLTVDIKPPTYETRMAILRRKVQEENLSIDDSILDFIASNVSSNIRELQGAITKVIAFSKLRHNDITMDLAKQALSDMIAPDKKKEITIDYIIETVADHFNISTNDLLSSKRSSNISHPRQICMYLCCELTNNTLDVIKKHLNRKDHSTIIHGRDNIKKLLEDTDANPKVAKDIDILIKKINPQ